MVLILIMDLHIIPSLVVCARGHSISIMDLLWLRQVSQSVRDTFDTQVAQNCKTYNIGLSIRHKYFLYAFVANHAEYVYLVAWYRMMYKDPHGCIVLPHAIRQMLKGVAVVQNLDTMRFLGQKLRGGLLVSSYGGFELLCCLAWDEGFAYALAAEFRAHGNIDKSSALYKIRGIIIHILQRRYVAGISILMEAYMSAGQPVEHMIQFINRIPESHSLRPAFIEARNKYLV